MHILCHDIQNISLEVHRQKFSQAINLVSRQAQDIFLWYIFCLLSFDMSISRSVRCSLTCLSNVRDASQSLRATEVDAELQCHGVGISNLP